jgi:hypothetical protein
VGKVRCGTTRILPRFFAGRDFSYDLLHKLPGRPIAAYGGPAGLAGLAPLSLRYRWLALDGRGDQRKVGGISPCHPVIPVIHDTSPLLL